MSLRLAGHLIIGSVTPSEDPVTIGYVWVDTGTSKLKICTAVSPYVWAEISGTGGASAWGDITGTLSSQTDLQTALDAKINTTGLTDDRLLGRAAGANSTLGPYVTLGAGLEFYLVGGEGSGLQVNQSYFDALYAALSHTHPQADITDLIADLTAKEATANKNAANGYAGLSAASKLTGSQQTYGILANTACEGNDSRLSDSRAPTAHSITGAAHTFPGGGTTYLRDDGVFAAVTATPPVLVGPSNVVSTVEAIAANTFVHVGRQLEITDTGSIEIPATSTLEITP